MGHAITCAIMLACLCHCASLGAALGLCAVPHTIQDTVLPTPRYIWCKGASPWEDSVLGVSDDLFPT